MVYSRKRCAFMITIIKTNDEDSWQVLLKDDLSFKQAEKYKKELSEKMGKIKKIQINIEEMGEVNLLVLQILKASCNTFNNENISYTWESSTDHKFLEIIKLVGLDLKAG